MIKFKRKANSKVNNIKAFLLENDVVINSKIELQLNLLENLLIDYYNANDSLKNRGYIVTFNKNTSYGLNPILKLKYNAIKEIRKIINEIIPKEIDNTESVEDFINRLTT